nr:hypothetical protein [Tanacetum cinerariifolium]
MPSLNSIVRAFASLGHDLERMPSLNSIVRAFASLGHDLGLGGGAGDNIGEGGNSIGGSVHAGIGTTAGIEILAIVQYAGCGGGVAADSSVSMALSPPRMGPGQQLMEHVRYT